MTVAHPPELAPSPKTDSAPDWLRKGRIPSLDGLRAIAVLLVVYDHASFTAGFPRDWLVPLRWSGRTGVDIFFVLSGFLITTLLCREIERTGRVHIRAFFLRRVLRIIPAYLCYVAAVAAFQWAGRLNVPDRDWLAVFTYTVNFLTHPTWEIAHIWSLSVEEHFYLMWPLIVAAAGLAGGRRAALACVVACCALRWVILLAVPDLFEIPYCTFTRLDTIATGCLLALLAREAAWRARFDWLTQRLWPVLLLAALGDFTRPIAYKVGYGFGYTTTAVGIALVLWWAVRHEHAWLGRLLNSRLLGAIGVGSYSIYLWQQLFLPRSLGAAWYSAFPQNVVFAFVAAWLSYRIIEKPFLNLKARLGEPAAAPVAAAPAAAANPTPALPRRVRQTAMAPAGVR